MFVVNRGDGRSVLALSFDRNLLSNLPGTMGEDLSNKLDGQGGESVTSEDRFTEGQSSVEHLIEELKHRSAELEGANRELRRVSHYRSLFLGRMSHELRTPLTSILGFTEILLDQEQLTDNQRRFCKKIQDSGLQLQASLDQLVDLSRIEAGRTEIFLQEFALRDIVRDSCAAATRLAHKRQVKIDYDVVPRLTTIVSDEGRLRQILYSFLAWCVSRSAAGQCVKLDARIIESARVSICLDDEGDRIEDLIGVFDPQDRAGSGDLPNMDELGVIIGRRLVDMLGGTVVIENRETAGARVLIELPARPAKG
jgi:signal transduction histidine kinase